MLNLTFDLATGKLVLVSPVPLKATSEVPVTITFSSVPSSATGLSIALGSGQTPQRTLAFNDDFIGSGATRTATLNANDIRMQAFMTGKGGATLDIEFAGVINGFIWIVHNVKVLVQAGVVTGPEASDSGPTYLTAGQVQDLIDTAVGAGAWQPLDSDLTAIAALSTTSFGRSALTDANAAGGRSRLGLVIGTDVQAFSSTLAALVNNTSGTLGFTNVTALFAGLSLTPLNASFLSTGIVPPARIQPSATLRVNTGGAQGFSSGGALLAGPADFPGQLCFTTDGVAFSIARSTSAGGTHDNLVCLNDVVIFTEIRPGRIDANSTTANGVFAGAAHRLRATGAVPQDNVLVLANDTGLFAALTLQKSGAGFDNYPCATFGTSGAVSAGEYNCLYIATNSPDGVVDPIPIGLYQEQPGRGTHRRIRCDYTAGTITCYGLNLAGAVVGTLVTDPVAWTVNAAGQFAAAKVLLTGGAITGTTISGLTITSSTGTITIVNGKTARFNQTITIAGTDGTVMTFPSTSATVARTDLAQSFTGIQTFLTAIAVASGGTGNATLTAYAPIFGGTTTTGAIQSGTVGTLGQVLTSNGPAALPTFQTPASGYTLMIVGPPGASPADSLTYYMGADLAGGLTTAYANVRMEIPKAGTISRVSIHVHVATLAGSSETVNHFIRINDTTDVAAINTSYDGADREGVAIGVGQAVIAGDFIALKIVTPAWVTNPTGVRWSAIVYIST